MKVSGGYNFSEVLREVLNMLIFTRRKHWLEMCRGWVPFQLSHSLSLWPWANYLTGSATAQFVRSVSGSTTVSFLLSICLLTILKFLECRLCVCVAAVPSPGTAQILIFVTITIVLGLQETFTSLDQSTQQQWRNLNVAI